MPAVKRFSDLIGVILDVLAEDKFKKWTQEQLRSAVNEKVLYKDHFIIDTAIKSLVASGRVGGAMQHGNRAAAICYREFNSDLLTDATKTGEVIQKLKDTLTQAAADLTKTLEERNTLLNQLEELKKAEPAVARIDLVVQKGKVKIVDGLFHAQLPKILKLAAARMNIFIYGPTGCGKSHVCEQAAKELGLNYGFVSCTSGMSEGALGGRLLPVGINGKFEYVMSDFVRCYEEGGLFLLDEIDAADPNVLLVVNSALANGKLAVTNRPKKPYAVRHPDFICAAAANTVGTGADRLYSGRNKLDAATLDRFAIGKVYMDYDNRVEEALCPNVALRTKLLQYRTKIRAHKMERAMSTRFMRDAYVMVENGFTFEDVDQAFFQGWREDEVNKVKVA